MLQDSYVLRLCIGGSSAEANRPPILLRQSHEVSSIEAECFILAVNLMRAQPMYTRSVCGILGSQARLVMQKYGAG